MKKIKILNNTILSFLYYYFSTIYVQAINFAPTSTLDVYHPEKEKITEINNIISTTVVLLYLTILAFFLYWIYLCFNKQTDKNLWKKYTKIALIIFFILFIIHNIIYWNNNCTESIISYIYNFEIFKTCNNWIS